MASRVALAALLLAAVLLLVDARTSDRKARPDSTAKSSGPASADPQAATALPTGVNSQKAAATGESPGVAFSDSRPFMEADKDLDDVAVFDQFSLPSQVDKFDHLSTGGGFVDDHDSFSSIDLDGSFPEFANEDLNVEADNM